MVARRLSRCASLALAATLSGVRLVGGADAPTKPPSAPSFPAESQVVLLDMVVRDADAQPVTDLRPDEVQVFENGRRCDIVSFRLIQASARTAQRAAEPPTGATPGPPTTTTAPAATPARPALVVLVFDQLGPGAAHRALTAGEQLAAMPFPAGTSFAVFKAGSGLRAVQTFTTDRGLLAAAVRSATSGGAAGAEGPLGDDPNLVSQSLTEQAGRGEAREGGLMIVPRLAEDEALTLGEIPSRVLAFVDAADRTRQAFGSLDALLAVVKGLEPIQGRKTVVYFSESLQAGADARGLYELTIAEANRANVAFYAVDARGLTIERPDRGAQALLDAAAVHTGTASSTRLEAAIENAVHGNPQGNLAALASDTGGFLSANTDNLGPAMARVASEVSSYYEAAYVPAEPAQDGRFRRIDAKVARKGVTLRTRSGYFARAAGSPRVADFELPLLAALDVAQPPRELEARTAALVFAPRGTERETVLLLQVKLAGVELATDEERQVYRGHLAALALVRDARGAVVARLAQDWPVEGPLAERARRLEGLAALRHSFRLAPGSYTLEAAVRDQQTGRIGVEKTSFEVPAASGLAASSLTFVRRAEVAAEKAQRSAVPGAGTGPDPLHVGRVTISPELPPLALPETTAELPYFLSVYPAAAGALPAAPPAAVEVQLEIRQDGRPVARAHPVLPRPEPDGCIPLLGSIAVDSLDPGGYELVATAIQGESRAQAAASFSIARPAAANAPARARDPELERLLRLAGDYVVAYEGAFQNLVTEELYEQRAMAGAQHQTTRAELVFARLPGEIPWGSFRDVFELNGRPLRDRDARLERLFRDGGDEAAERARAILRENAAFNIGSAERTVNIPTLPLLFLHPRNQARFAFRAKGSERVAERETRVVEFEEVARPTVVREGSPGLDLPASGRFWIDARQGTVLRSRTRFPLRGGAAAAELTTEYRPEPRLAMWVPASMRESYFDLPGHVAVFGAGTEAVARYSNFRRFTVETDERARLPED